MYRLLLNYYELGQHKYVKKCKTCTVRTCNFKFFQVDKKIAFLNFELAIS